MLGQQFQVRSEPLRLIWAVNGTDAQETRGAVLCALGQPHLFLQNLEQIGFIVQTQKLLQDHDPLTAGNLFEELGEGPIVVTAKDWIKLRERRDLDLSRVIVALQRVSIEPEDEFMKWLRGRLMA